MPINSQSGMTGKSSQSPIEAFFAFIGNYFYSEWKNAIEAEPKRIKAREALTENDPMLYNLPASNWTTKQKDAVILLARRDKNSLAYQKGWAEKSTSQEAKNRLAESNRTAQDPDMWVSPYRAMAELMLPLFPNMTIDEVDAILTQTAKADSEANNIISTSALTSTVPNLPPINMLTQRDISSAVAAARERITNVGRNLANTRDRREASFMRTSSGEEVPLTDKELESYFIGESIKNNLIAAGVPASQFTQFRIDPQTGLRIDMVYPEENPFLALSGMDLSKVEAAPRTRLDEAVDMLINSIQENQADSMVPIDQIIQLDPKYYANLIETVRRDNGTMIGTKLAMQFANRPEMMRESLTKLFNIAPEYLQNDSAVNSYTKAIQLGLGKEFDAKVAEVTQLYKDKGWGIPQGSIADYVFNNIMAYKLENAAILQGVIKAPSTLSYIPIDNPNYDASKPRSETNDPFVRDELGNVKYHDVEAGAFIVNPETLEREKNPQLADSRLVNASFGEHLTDFGGGEPEMSEQELLNLPAVDVNGNPISNFGITRYSQNYGYAGGLPVAEPTENKTVQAAKSTATEPDPLLAALEALKTSVKAPTEFRPRTRRMTSI